MDGGARGDRMRPDDHLSFFLSVKYLTLLTNSRNYLVTLGLTDPAAETHRLGAWGGRRAMQNSFDHAAETGSRPVKSRMRDLETLSRRCPLGTYMAVISR